MIYTDEKPARPYEENNLLAEEILEVVREYTLQIMGTFRTTVGVGKQ